MEVGREVQALAFGCGVWLDVFQKLPVFLLESSYSDVLVKVNVIGDMSSGRCRWGQGGKETLSGVSRAPLGLCQPLHARCYEPRTQAAISSWLLPAPHSFFSWLPFLPSLPSSIFCMCPEGADPRTRHTGGEAGALRAGQPQVPGA